MLLASVAIMLASYTDPCPVKDPEVVHPSIPYEFPNEADDHACWNAYKASRATALGIYWACINSISPTAPNVCALRAKCEAFYDAWMTGAEEGYIECVLEQ